MYIVIGADFVPTESNRDFFINGKIEKLVGEELKEILQNASYRIFNLEVPLTDKETPILKEGPNLSAPTSCVAGYTALNVNLLTLANNHILDQGNQGLTSTIRLLDENGIFHVGAGLDLSNASHPFIFSFGEKRVGIYACAEYEFSIAGDNKPGANPFDPLESLDHISKMKGMCDYCVVLYHGGKEHYRYPSPYLQKVCRKMVEKGADLIVCQHSHCVGCREEYLHGTIIYGQGNFIFDNENNEFWNTSVLLKLHDSCKVDYIPIIKTGNVVRLANDVEANKILSGFFERSEEINKPGLIEKKYSEFAEKNGDNYMIYLSGIGDNIIFRLINKLSGYRFQNIWAKRYRRHYKSVIRNYIECEAHRELLLKSLQL